MQHVRHSRFDASIGPVSGAVEVLHGQDSFDAASATPGYNLRRIWTCVAAIGSLAACTPDVATTAATAGKLAADQAKQAKAQEAAIRKEIGAALEAAEKAASAAAQP